VVGWLRVGGRDEVGFGVVLGVGLEVEEVKMNEDD